ncbi:Alpha-2-macroglobulin [hydrothermal vent metagenome]|uniref:Alpha-2-macroglobulin n=1 Tax=hydrothermal vent metagenome TaxID=652676 RepID=A0A3B0ZMJ2_9ZZZZ
MPHTKSVSRYFTLWTLLIWGFSFSAFALNLDKAREQFSQTGFQLADVSEASYDDAPAISVTFSVPLDEGFEKYLNVSIKNGEQVKGGWILSKSGTTAYFTNIEPVTEYSITIYRGLKAITGKQLKTTHHKTLKTREIKSSVAFASSGNVLPVDSSQGLPLYTININAVDVDFHRVKPDKVSQFIYHWAQRQSQDSWSLSRYLPFIELVHSGRFELKSPKNKRHRTNLPVKDLAALQEPGIYMAVMKPAGEYPYNYQATYFVVSDMGLHARFYPDRIDLYSNSLEQAKPMAGVEVTLLGVNGEMLAQQQSSPEGLATFHNPSKKARVLLAQNGDHLALLKILGPALDLSAFDLGKRQQRATEAFIYGPRDLYRPGEKVIFNALLRDADGGLIGDTPLRAILRGADHREAQSTVWHGNDLSYYYHEYQLPTNAATGEWRLQLKIGSKIVGEYPFKVEEFLPERMMLALDDGVKGVHFFDVASKDKLEIPVEGSYLYGAPAAKNRLSSFVTISQQPHPIEAYKEHHFGNVTEHKQTRRLDLDDIYLDDKGLGVIKTDNKWKKVRSPLDIHVVGSLYESGGRPVVRDINYTTWPGDGALIGIRPLFDKEELDGDTMAGFEIIKSDQNGHLHRAEGLEVKLVRERRNYFWVFDDDRGWHREHTENFYTAFSSNLDIDETKRASFEVPVEWGGYRLEIRDPDTGLISSIRFRAGWWYGDGDNGSSARPDRVELKLDKKRYKNGDVVKVTVTAPYAGEGFILLEGDQALFWQRIDVPAEGMTIDIPIDEKWNQHNLYLSAVVFRPSRSLSENMPNRAMGLLHLPLDRESRKLNVSVTVPAEKVVPETTLRTRIKVEGMDNSGKPVMVTLAAVDIGVLNITDFETPDAHQWFFEQRRYGIDSRDMYGAIIDSLEGDLAIQRFGGDADLSRGGKKAQSEVLIVSLFSGAVALNGQGEAEIPFELPDFNGRMRLMALAFNGDQYGSAEAEVTVAAPVIVEISMPRFLANGDQSTMTLDLHNLSGEPQTLSVKSIAVSALHMENESRSVTLADGEKQALNYPLNTSGQFGRGDILVSVSNDAEYESSLILLNRQWGLNVRPAYPALTRSLRKVLKKGETLAIDDELKGLMLDTVGAELVISTQPPIELNSHLKQLLAYPYGCLEQTTSSTYPWVFATQDNIDRLGLNEIKSGKVKLDERLTYLEQGLDRIRNLQLASGGFGLWNSADSEQHWLTAYVADFLTDVHEQGVAVDDGLFKKSMERLVQYVNTTNGMFGERWSHNSAHYRLAYRAYAAYVLSKLNRAPLGSLRNMYDQQRADAKTGLPLVHLGLALIKQGDRQRGLQAIEAALQLPVNQDRYSYYGDYGSALRDLSLMVYLLEKYNIDVAGRAELLFKLADAVAGRDYLSTQERLALFKTGVALSKIRGKSWAGELLIAKSKQTVRNTGQFQRVFNGKTLAQGFSFTSNYDENLFTQMTISGYPKEVPEPVNNGIWVERDYYDVNGNLLAKSSEEGKRTLPQLETGDLVVVHLRVNAKRRIPDALLVDLLPAGLELENQNLKHAVKLDQLKIDGKSFEELQRNSVLKHQEYRDDRYVAAFNLNEWGHTDLFYLARAVTPGTYTVPSAYVEDMYRPFIQGVSHVISDLVIVNKSRGQSH